MLFWYQRSRADVMCEGYRMFFLLRCVICRVFLAEKSKVLYEVEEILVSLWLGVLVVLLLSL